MPGFDQNGKLYNLADASAGTDGTAYSQLTAAQAAMIAVMKGQAYIHGSVQSGTFVNLFASGNTTIDSSDVGTKLFYARELYVTVQTRSGLPVLAAVSISVGWTSPNYNDIKTITITDIAGLTSTGLSIVVPVSNAVAGMPANTPLVARVTGLATGIGAALTVGVDVLGAYR